MNILLIGSGGREHALAWKLLQSASFDPSTDTLYAAPGNPGIAAHGTLVTLSVTDHAAVIAFCQAKMIGLVVIGPEAPLVDGLADSVRAAGVPVFGPSAKAAQLEGSKGFTKDMCSRAGIPTAGYARHHTLAAARADLARFGLPVVIKADGLAAGKGVVIADTTADAEAALDMMFDGAFGDAGAEVVLEEFMTGEEVSYFALTDGTTVVPFGSAQDHKRVGDGDTGPNTGGMGAYSPASILTKVLENKVLAEIIRPTVQAMAAAGTPYSGVLYAGLMLTASGPKLIEYNARFGDPECQVLMMRFKGDLVALLNAVAAGTLAQAAKPDFEDTVALTIVMAAQGYPDAPEKGGSVTIGDVADAVVFHAGTAIVDGRLVASGGRVLSVTAAGKTATDARDHAYRALDGIVFPTGFYRNDIGWREVAREA